MDISQRDFIANLAGDASQLAQVAPRLQRGLGNVVTGVVDQLSTSPLDFVYQLLQNADDKEYEPGVIPEVGFSIKPTRGGYVHAWDNGLPMSKEQVEALVTFRSTKKNDVGTIGEKGVGWHSVFRISHSPHIYSGGFSFKLGSADLETMLSPQWVETKDLPFTPNPGTNFFLPLRDLDDATLQNLGQLRDHFSPKTLLFLRKIRRVRIEPQRFSVELDGDVWTLRVSASKAKMEKEVQKVVVVRPPAAELPSDIRCRDPRFVLAFPLAPSGIESMFAWLPVMPSGLKFLLHGDFVTTLSREALLADPWNMWLWQQLPNAIASSIEQLTSSLSSPLAKSWTDLWPSDKVYITELQDAIDSCETILGKRPVIVTESGFQCPQVCVLAEVDEMAILPATELAGIGLHYPVHRTGQVLLRFGAQKFTADLFRQYLTQQPASLLARYEAEDDLLDHVVQYLQRHDVQDIAFLPIASRSGPRLESPSGQLIPSSREQVAHLSDMGLAVVRSPLGPVACAWLEGLGLRRASTEAVLDTILNSQKDLTDPEVSVLQLRYLHSVLDQLPGTSCTRLANEFLVWVDSNSGEVLRCPLREAHVREKTLMNLFSARRLPTSVSFLSSSYDLLGVAALEKLGAWATVRLEERTTEVSYSHRSHALMDQWLEKEKLPATASSYKFQYWTLPDDVCQYMAQAPAAVKIAFLELAANHWEAYEPCRILRVHHTWRSKRLCTHGQNTCEQCSFMREQRWDLPPFLQKLRALEVPTTLGPSRDCWKQLDHTILLPAKERARLCGLHLPLPVLAADIDNSSFLAACGVATEVSADILLRGLRQLRERKPDEEVLRLVQAFYGLLERLTNEDAFTLTDEWPILACDPCPTELERQVLSEKSDKDLKERQAALQSRMSQSLKWFALKDVRWEGPAPIVQGQFALLANQRTMDARRVYTRFVADMLRVPDVGASDLIDVLDRISDRGRLSAEKVNIVVRIYEHLALGTRTNSLDENLLGRLRRRLLTHRHTFVSGLVFACDNFQDLGLAQNSDVHFLHFPQAVASHPGFLAQLRIPLAKNAIKTTYVGQVGAVDRSATDAVRRKLEWLVRVVVHLLPEARQVHAADWARVGEFARVEVVPEVMVKVELGPAHTERQMRHAVDWSPNRCVVMLAQEHRAARSARSQRLLTLGVAELFAVVCSTSTTTELIRLIGLILGTPQSELDDLAEDERLPKLPSAVKAALRQAECKAPTTLLAPLRDAEGKEDEDDKNPLEGADGADETNAVNEEERSDSQEDFMRIMKEGLKIQKATPIARNDEFRKDISELESVRLRIEAAIAREDAEEAQSALAEHPLPLDEELAERVEALVEEQSLVTSLREAVHNIENSGVEALRAAIHRIESAGARGSSAIEALAEARKRMQEVERHERRTRAIARLADCRSYDSSLTEVESALMEAWESGVDQTHADFIWATVLLETERLRVACEAVEEALQTNPRALREKVESLKQQLARAGPSEEKRKQGMRLLKKVKQHQIIASNLSNALSRMDATLVEVALEEARMVPMAATLVAQAETWLDQRKQVDYRREFALDQLRSAKDADELAVALCNAREVCPPEELAVFELRFQESNAVAEQARMALREAHNVEMLRDALQLLPVAVLSNDEVTQWCNILQEWEARAHEATTVFYSSPKEVHILQEALQNAVGVGVGPATLEAMQAELMQVSQVSHVLHAIDEVEKQQAQWAWQREQQCAMWSKHLSEENNLTMESLEAALAFAREVSDERMQMLAESLLSKLVKAEEYWQVAEKSDLATDWKLAAAACRSCRQLRRSQDAEARARKGQAREETERKLTQAMSKEELLPTLQRAQELGVSDRSIAAGRARLAHCMNESKSRPARADAEAARVPQRMLPGEYTVKLFGKWEKVSPYGAEVLSELGLLEQDAKVWLGPTELPLPVVVQPHGYAAVEGDVLNDRAQRLQEKLADITVLEERILRKERLSKEEWHAVAHKSVHLHELRRLQAKIMASGCEKADFSEVWEAIDIVKSSGNDPFGRHLLEGAPAEPQIGWAPPGLAGHQHGNGDVGKRVGALGELYVFTWLQKLIAGFGFGNWCSSCRAVHPDAPTPEDDIDQAGCDFRFFDHSGLFCQNKEILIEVKSMRVSGDPANVRASDFACHISSNELAVMQRANESDIEYYMLMWVAIGAKMECRVVAMIRQPYELIPAQLALQPTQYKASLSQNFAPPGLEIAWD